jgi:hypothetical protein
MPAGGKLPGKSLGLPVNLMRLRTSGGRPLRFFKLSQALPAILNRYLRPCWRRRFVSAMRTSATVYRWDNNALYLVAAHRTPQAFADARRRSPHSHPGPKTITGRMLPTKTVVHIVDAATQAGFWTVVNRRRSPGRAKPIPAWGSLLAQIGSMPCALRPLRYAPRAVTLPKKSIFNFRVNTMQPLLRPVGYFPVRIDFGF